MLKLHVNTDNSRPVSLYEFMWSAILQNMHNTKGSFQTADQLKNESNIIQTVLNGVGQQKPIV